MNDTSRLLPSGPRADRSFKGARFQNAVVADRPVPPDSLGRTSFRASRRREDFDIVGIDKHSARYAALTEAAPRHHCDRGRLGRRPANWSKAVAGADAVVVAHAQIGGLSGGRIRLATMLSLHVICSTPPPHTAGCHLVHMQLSGGEFRCCGLVH